MSPCFKWYIFLLDSLHLLLMRYTAVPEPLWQRRQLYSSSLKRLSRFEKLLFLNISDSNCFNGLHQERFLHNGLSASLSLLCWKNLSQSSLTVVLLNCLEHESIWRGRSNNVFLAPRHIHRRLWGYLKPSNKVNETHLVPLIHKTTLEYSMSTSAQLLKLYSALRQKLLNEGHNDTN